MPMASVCMPDPVLSDSYISGDKVKFISVLSSVMPRDRGVQFIGGEDLVTRSAESWLDAQGEYGDSFTVYEIVWKPVKILHCDKAAPPLPAPKPGHHAFKQSRSGIRCDVCNGSREAHL